MKIFFFFLLCFSTLLAVKVINTWSGVFEQATAAGYATLLNGSVLDALEVGCGTCEDAQCDGSVGFGNHPDTRGTTSLDAMIMDGDSMDVGSVAFIRKYRKAISLARQVMTFTQHTLLVGDGAEEFAFMLGLTKLESASTIETKKLFLEWKQANCQPNFYTNLEGADNSCGPYSPYLFSSSEMKDISDRRVVNRREHKTWAKKDNHDTIGMVVLDDGGHMGCGTTTNGANHKVSGRVGDSPIAGAGCYVDSLVGGAAATGDGDVMMRFLPSFKAVELMRTGLDPNTACEKALEPIASHYPSFSGGIVCMNNKGEVGGASYNMSFSYSVASDETNGSVQVITVQE